MWWFTNREEQTMARRLRERRAIAQQLARDVKVSHLATNNNRLATDALRHAQDDEALFERVFGEPMPAQLRIALHLEVDLWTDTKNKLNDQRVVQRRLATIQQLQTLEREMLHTPLVRRYTQAVERLQRERTAGQ